MGPHDKQCECVLCECVPIHFVKSSTLKKKLFSYIEITTLRSRLFEL